MKNKSIKTFSIAFLLTANAALCAGASQGVAVSHGDVELGAAAARAAFGVDGTGVKIGVLAHSMANQHPGYARKGTVADLVSRGELPPSIDVFLDNLYFAETSPYQPATNNALPVMEIAHDMAPGATFAFRTSANGEADFAAGIRQLADAGASVIVDDTLYLTEPVWQDGGQIADAVNYAIAKGAVYVSAAGAELGRLRYEAAFNGSGVFRTIGGKTVELHDFDPGPGVDTCQQVTAYHPMAVAFHWAQPYASIGNGPGAATDMDIFVMDETCQTVMADALGRPTMATTDNTGRDPVEAFATDLPSADLPSGKVGVVIGRARGPSPGLMRVNLVTQDIRANPQPFVYTMGTEMGATTYNRATSYWEWATEGPTLFGHANLPGVIATATVQAETRNVVVYGIGAVLRSSGTMPIENFNPLGGTPMLFDVNGTPLPTPVVRVKPDVTGVDAGFTWLWGSQGGEDFAHASAAHVAGIAALIRQAVPAAGPAQVAAALRATATLMADTLAKPVAAPGFNYATGYGLANAQKAVAYLMGLPWEPAVWADVPDQAISIGPWPVRELTVGDATVLPVSSGWKTKFPVLSSQTPGICAVSGYTVRTLSPGYCIVAADYPDNTLFTATDGIWVYAKAPAPPVTPPVNGGPTAGSDTLTPANCLFDWAEKNYPGMFPAGGSATQYTGDHTYRHYPATGTYLYVLANDGHVYYQGPDGKATDVGLLSDWQQRIGCQIVRPPNQCMFDWVEASYPGLFAPAAPPTGMSGPYNYRYYYATNAYLAVFANNQHLVYQGPDGVMLDKGPVGVWLSRSGCQ